MSGLVATPLNLIKRMLVYDREDKQQRHNENLCEALTADEIRSSTNYTNEVQPISIKDSSIKECPPLTIVTRDGQTIPPAADDVFHDDIAELCDDFFITNSGTQTTPGRFSNSDHRFCTRHVNNNNSQVNRIIQVPSEICLISPTGAVSDSCLPDKIVRIRQKWKEQTMRCAKRQHEKAERDRQRELLLRQCTLSRSRSYQSGITSTYPSDVTLCSKDRDSISHRHQKKQKLGGRRAHGLFLRSGNQLKQERPLRECQCCCCSRSFCHHKTDYMKEKRNPSCETLHQK